MKKRIEKEQEQDETLFERWYRQERSKKLAQNDVLFFGLSVLLAFYATQSLVTIQ